MISLIFTEVHYIVLIIILFCISIVIYDLMLHMNFCKGCHSKYLWKIAVFSVCN